MNRLVHRMQRPASILVATYQGYPGDTDTPFLTPVLRKLIQRGHTLKIMLGQGVRQTRLPVSARLERRLVDLGATLVAFHPPEMHPFDRLPLVKGLIGSWMPAPLKFSAAIDERAGMVPRLPVLIP